MWHDHSISVSWYAIKPSPKLFIFHPHFLLRNVHMLCSWNSPFTPYYMLSKFNSHKHHSSSHRYMYHKEISINNTKHTSIQVTADSVHPKKQLHTLIKLNFSEYCVQNHTNGPVLQMRMWSPKRIARHQRKRVLCNASASKCALEWAVTPFYSAETCIQRNVSIHVDYHQTLPNNETKGLT